MPRNLKHQLLSLKNASNHLGRSLTSSQSLTRGLLLLIATLVAMPAHGQQSMRPANFGAPQPAKSGNWFKRLPWANKSKKRKKSSRAPLKKKDVSPEQEREGQYAMARLAEKRDQTEAAKAIYGALIKRDPEDHRPYHRLGVMAAIAGNQQQAEEMLTAAYQRNAKDPEVFRDLGYLYYKQDKLDKAEHFYKRGLALDPKHQAIANNYAMLLAEAEMHEDALTLFKRVNEPAEAHANMGFMLAQMGQIDKASDYFSHALTLDKELKSAAHGLMQVAEVRKRVEALRVREMKMAEAEKQPKPTGVQASLSDEGDEPVASRIASSAKPSVESIRVVNRVEPKSSTPAPPAKRLTPVRVGAPAQTLQQPQSSTPSMFSRRRPVGVKPVESSTQANQPGKSAAPSNARRVGPARTSHPVQLRAVKKPAPDSRQPKATASTNAKAPTNASAAPAAPTTGGLPSADFHWSTSRFPTSGPTWTPNTAKTEVPPVLLEQP